MRTWWKLCGVRKSFQRSGLLATLIASHDADYFLPFKEGLRAFEIESLSLFRLIDIEENIYS